ncbi:MAG: glucose-1-phosphate cytidylyltransferase [Actinobacteria bacterium]|nr:MAG: glucose-1-phosphate cytidylyltransferase [Actinomycetota bacterium]
MTDVVILCGGKGTRLAEETGLRPKPMVEVGGMPLLWHIMKHYAAAGHTRFVLALGYKGDYIKSWFLHYRMAGSDLTITLDPKVEPVVHGGAAEPWEVVLVDTGEESLKGARIKRLASHLTGDRFHVTYGDGVGDVDIAALEASHVASGATGTITGVRPPSRFGELAIEGDRVVRFEEKPQLAEGGSYINGGFMVFERAFLDRLTTDESCDLEFGALQDLAADGGLGVWRHDGFWQCMDTVRDRDYLERRWAAGDAPWKTWE